jgi:predicted ATP-dependent serine protease
MIKLAKGNDAMGNIKPLEWIWEPLIPRNCVSILASRGGVGKSGFALWLANELAGIDKEVLYIDAERCGFHIKQRIKDWNLKHWEKITFTVSDLIDGSTQTAAPSTFVELYDLIKQCHPDLVILDSLTVFSRGIDTNSRCVMAGWFEELTKIASECNTGILLLAHTKKKQNIDDSITLDSIAGSGAITDLARSVMLMDFDYGEEDRIITQLKLNLSAKSKPLSFKITSSGISDLKFIGDIERTTGTKADNLRLLAMSLLKSGMSKKETRAALKLEGASPVEYGRAIDWASEKLGIKWNGEIKE